MARVGLVGIGAVLAASWACSTRPAFPPLPVLDDPCADAFPAGTYELSVRGNRLAPLVVVGGGGGPRGAVMMLHGAGGDGSRMIQVTAWDELAREPRAKPLVAVFPEGTGPFDERTWNAGDCCGSAVSVAADDVGYLDEIADAVRDATCADRVVGAGHSNGGMMALRWTCEGAGPDLVVSSAGALMVDACGGVPAPAIVWHGADDPVVPLEGGGGQEGVPFLSHDATVEAIVARNGGGVPEAPTSDGDLTCRRWPGEADTVACVVSNWKHAWPGGPDDRETGPTLERFVVDALEGADDTDAETPAESGERR
jgi:polyhydroxybutyrate depolymerase